jgi:hypothetical protein
MTVINFYFSDYEWWINYLENNQIKMKVFTSEEELKTFITINKLPLTYKEWHP